PGQPGAGRPAGRAGAGHRARREAGAGRLLVPAALGGRLLGLAGLVGPGPLPGARGVVVRGPGTGGGGGAAVGGPPAGGLGGLAGEGPVAGAGPGGAGGTGLLGRRRALVLLRVLLRGRFGGAVRQGKQQLHRGLGGPLGRARRGLRGALGRLAPAPWGARRALVAGGSAVLTGRLVGRVGGGLGAVLAAVLAVGVPAVLRGLRLVVAGLSGPVPVGVLGPE